jgi:hypothetical protein
MEAEVATVVTAVTALGLCGRRECTRGSSDRHRRQQDHLLVHGNLLDTKFHGGIVPDRRRARCSARNKGKIS